VRLGLSVPKRLGAAVLRNRARRHLREIFRRNRGAFGGRGGRLVVNLRPSAAEASFEELSVDFLSAVGRALTRIAPPR
jgi:ribonuclease P protein component